MNQFINLMPVLLILLLAGGAGYGVYRLRKKARELSREAFGTDSLAEGLKLQADLLAETPKSVTGMTKVYLPQIEEDFPEFNWAQFKQKCENMLNAYLAALEHMDLSLLKDAAAELKEQTALQIAEIKDGGESERYRQVKIHCTEIARYVKREGLCMVRIQSAVEYYHDIGEKESERKEQCRYNMELVYVQDVTKVKDFATATGVVCPHCGAPVTSLGSKFCEYCGSAVVPINDRVWTLHRIEKM